MQSVTSRRTLELVKGVTTEMFAIERKTPPAPPTRRTGRLALGGFISVALAAVSVGLVAGPASAAVSDLEDGEIHVLATVEAAITFRSTSEDIHLSGAPDEISTTASILPRNSTC